jgi:serine/threonine protein kinase/WD40 repeat protein
LDLLAEEFLSRHRRGERPTVEEYAGRRPDLASEIRAVFPTLLLVEDLGKDSVGQPAPDPAVGTLGSIGETAGKALVDPASGLQRLGEYRILREIGRGGMGIVYEAEQESLGRRVAIKVLPFHSLLGAKHLVRFRQEARAAARLSHPNIVPVFGVGEHLGLHYFVMQYIPGHGLDAVIEEVRRLRKQGRGTSDSSIASELDTGGPQRYHQNVARIARDAAMALDHAHGEGVLHRDVKPSNLLLDPTGHVWLADFGLAKSEGSDDLTRSGDFVGTFRYMAPERFKGWSDPRSDVYSLGLTLYELLALRPAFAESDRGRLMRKVAAEEPPALRRIDRALPRDLETIVLKATAKEPSQRYTSAQSMAQELGRYLRGEPVEARRSTALGKFARWCSRNPVPAGLGSAVLALLLVVAVMSSHSAMQLKVERDLGREQLRGSYLTQARNMRLSRQPGQRFDALDSLVKAAKIRPGPDLCDEAAAVLALDDARSIKTWTQRFEERACFDGELKRVALSNLRGEVFVRSTDDGRELVRLPGPGYEVPFVYFRFHPDERHLAVYFESYKAFSRWTIWDLHRKEAIVRVEDGAGTAGIDFDPRDGSILVATQGGGLRTIDLHSGRTRLEQRFPTNIYCVSIHPGGELLALARVDCLDCELVDRSSGRVLRAFRHGMEPTGMAWDPRGRFLAVTSFDFRTYLWDAEAGVLRWSQKGHEAETGWASFQAPGDVFVTGGWDNKVHAWNAWSGRELFVLPRQFVHFSAAGNALGTVSEYGYDLFEMSPAPATFTLYGHEQPNAKHPVMIALSPGGRLAASCGKDGVRFWDLVARQEVAHLAVGEVLSIEFDDGGDHLITSGEHGLWRWPIRTRVAGERRRVVVGPPASIGPFEDLWRHALGDHGRKVALIHRRKHCHLLSIDDEGGGTKLEDVPSLERVAYSSDGRWIAGTARTLNRVVVWDAASGQQAKSIEHLYGCLAFDPQSRYLVVGALAEYQLLRAGAWEVVRSIPRPPGLNIPGPVAFDRSGCVMALAHTDSRIWLVEVESGKKITELEALDPCSLNSLSLDLDGGFLAASSLTQRCQIWDLRAMETQLAAAGLPWELHCRGEGPTREPFQVDAVFGGSIPGLPEDLDPRSPPLFRKERHSLFRPSLESYSDIDSALAAPVFLVSEGASWKYFRGLVEPSVGLEWTAPGYDDADWPAGGSGFNGQPTRDDETGTSLGDQMGSFTTLYLRHVFHLEDIDGIEKLLLALRFKDGFVAYLNGKEAARRNAGQPEERLPHDALASRAIDAPRPEFLAAIDSSLLVPGKNVLAIEGLVHKRSSGIFVLPVLAALLTPTEKRDRKRTDGLGKGPDGATDLVLAAYRSGRILQRVGKFEEAIVEYGRAISLDPASPEPVVRSIECRRRRSELEAAERLAREALERGRLVDDGGIWAEWSLVTFRDLHRPLAEALAAWPGSQATASRHGAELRSTVEDLAERGAVRINCGGPRFEAKDGKVWSADRFHLGGLGVREEPEAAAGPPISGTEEAPLYQSARSFPGDRLIRPAYRVPVPAGRYAVSLHFAEIRSKNPGGRVFGATIERKVVLESHELLRAGFAAAEVKSFDVEVRDGFLDLDFLAEQADPMISAIAIERRE